MSTTQPIDPKTEMPAITGEHRRILLEIYRHPLAHHLTWLEAQALIAHLGSVELSSDNVTTFQIGRERHRMRKPHGKDMTTSELLEVRHFLQRAGVAP